MKTEISRIIIFANGELPNKEKARALLRDDDFIIAADGGTRYVLELGKIAAQGASAEMIDSPKIREFYLGKK